MYQLQTSDISGCISNGNSKIKLSKVLVFYKNWKRLFNKKKIILKKC